MIGINGNLEQKKLTQSKNILLIDSSSQEDVLPFLKNKNLLIITFDYESHMFLENKNIDHIVSDDFLFDDDWLQIQNSTHGLSYWFNDSKISNLLEYDGINIGSLVFDETSGYLIKFLKKFWEIKRIFELNSSSHFTTSGILFEILSKFNVNLTILKTPSVKETFAHDKVRVNIKLGNYNTMLYVSKNSYQKLKNFSEKFLDIIFSPQKSSTNNHKRTLLVEFDVLRFQDFLYSSKNSSLDFLFYGRRRPAVWNKSSYSIMKTSNCKIITKNSLENKILLAITNKAVKKMNQNLRQLWENQDFFNSFFSVLEISVWDILHPIFIELIDQRIQNTIYEIELIKKLLQKHSFNNILILSEIGFTEQIILKQAQKNNIPVILLQAGLYWDTPEARSMNMSQGIFPINSDLFFVYGDIQKIDSIKNGEIPENKIFTLGSPRYDSISNLSNLSQNYVLLATTGPQPESIFGLNIKNIEEYKNSIIEIIKIVKSTNSKLIIKQHPSAAEFSISKIVKEIDPNVEVITYGDIIPLIKSCSVMISIGVSTSILEAQILHKPVISLPGINYHWGYPSVFESCLVSNLSDLKSNLNTILNDDIKRQELIKKGNIFAKKYVNNLGTSIPTIIKYLENFQL